MNALTQAYNEALISVIDQHAPKVLKTMLDKPRAEWFIGDPLEERRSLRGLEKQWLKSRLEVDRQRFTSARAAYNKLCDEAKAEFHRTAFDNANTKELFGYTDKISGTEKFSANLLPDIELSELPNAFADFFYSENR